jgi:hypothetical protein
MKSHLRKLVVATVLLFGATSGAKSEDDSFGFGVGTAFRLFVAKAFATVIVGDPAILDVRTDDDHSVLVEPLSAGETNLVFLDARGVVTANVRVSICGAPPAKSCTAGHSS